VHASFASEFPNDNAAISSGAVWVCNGLTGAATAEVPPFEPVPNEPFVFWFEDDDELEGPVELQGSSEGLSVKICEALDDDPEVGPLVESTEQPPASAAFAHFERALTAILMAHGASRSAALLPKLLRLESIPADALAKDVQLTLQSRGYLDGNTRYSARYRELCGAWTAVLTGASEDFSACGTTTLDRFGAELVAALLAVPATRADELRRELRKSGVAAFGVLEAA